MCRSDRREPERFQFDLGYGTGTQGDVLFTRAPDSPVVEPLPGPSYFVHGMGQQLVWTGRAGQGVKSMVGDAGIVDLIPVAPRLPVSGCPRIGSSGSARPRASAGTKT